jgi:hypothetical protein
MPQSNKVDNSLMERRGILDLLERLKGDGITLHEMEQIGVKFRQAGRRALRPLVRELWRESSGELITKYAYILDFFETDSWLDQLIQMALKRRDLGQDGKAALLIALEGYGVDVQAPPFKGELTGVGSNNLSSAVQGAIKLGEEGIVTFLDEFLSYPPDVQKIVIRELPKSGDPQGARMLEAILWHDDQAIVEAAIEALGRIPDPLAAGVLTRFIENGNPDLSGPAQKSLRRLSFLGIKAVPSCAALPFYAGYATPPDGDGYRSLLISRWVGEGRIAALYMQVHERRGLLAAWGAGDLSEAGFQAEREGFGVQDDLHQVSAGYVLEQVRDALYWSRDLCYLPADFYMRRGIFAGYDMTPAVFRPAFADQAQGRGLSYRRGEEISRELFADPFFAGWFMAGQRVCDFAEEYRNSEVKEQVLERFCSELLAPDLELIRERLLLSADLMLRCGRERGFVESVVALAGSLTANPLPHHLHPFLRGFALESMEIARESLERGDEARLQAVDEL